MKLIIGNKNYSSWSLRGWLACKQSGLHFEEMTVPLYGEDWDETKRNTDDIAPSSGKVPILWDGDAVVWDSLAIIEYLADKVGRDRFWPKADDARARFGKGGPFLFGSFCAADIIYAPVVSRFYTYDVPLPGFAEAYMDTIWAHEWMQAWIAGAEAEDWVIEQWEVPARA